ncbi:MAG TPA: ATP-binding protein [Burkholderiaceae bacterium]|nr:ATP-binding protein [Burkholderiaceae bacterium]
MPPGLKRQPDHGYASSWEHIEDELARLDLRIRAATLRRQLEEPVHLPHSPLRPAEAGGPAPATPVHEGGIPAAQAQLHALTADIEARRIASQAAGIHLALPRLANLFRLSTFEEQCLLVCVAPEVDAKYARHYALLQRDTARTQPSADLLLHLLCGTPDDRRHARRAFSSQSPLFLYRLLQIADASDGVASPTLSQALRIDPRIANHLLGIHFLDDRILPVARLLPGNSQTTAPALSAAQTTERMTAFIRHHLAASKAPNGLVFQLHGPDAAAQRAAVESVCSELALDVVRVDAAKAAASPVAHDLPWLIGREAVLLPAALCIEQTDALLENDKHAAHRDAWFAAIHHFSQLTFLLGQSLWSPGRLREGLTCIEVGFPSPSVQDRKALWETCIAARKVQAAVDPGALASRFRFDAEQIRLAMETAETLAYWRDPAGQALHADDIVQACRMQVSAKASGLARKAVPVNRWGQLVLPQDHLRQLRELCDQARHRHVVYGHWGFERRLSIGNGLNALFTGPPGTGKTMAAEVIAAELQADLLKIDLSQTVSKYIGETEKNLDQMFREAEAGNAILFFDEADALFGKRSEVKDAHDRYANIETGYLLQRMEQHEGIVILATNLRNNLDEAFCRRMHFVIEFPFPDEAHRTRLWEGLFPSDVPRDEAIDFRFMARQFKVPGGNIRNIGVCAAFLAAAEGKGLSMRHLILATRREYKKLGWPCNANDFGPYHEMLRSLDG